eukprot:325982_1
MDVTLNGKFDESYTLFKQHYKRQNANKHYPKSAEYARISFQCPVIYDGCSNVTKILALYYVMNITESLNETRQKVVTNAHENRGHTTDSKFEMERIAAGGLSRHISNDKTVLRVGLNLSETHQGTPFIQKSQFKISQVMDRRKKAAAEFQEVITSASMDR